MTANRVERQALADQVRALIDATVVAEAPADTLRTATAAVEAALAALRPHLSATRAPRYPFGGSFDSVADIMPFDPIMGPLSPMAPPITFSVEDGVSVGRVRFGAPWEGPPGCVHGGVLALAFDQVLNVANLLEGVAGPTKRLTLTFRKPTPLGVELRFEGRVERRDEREIHSRGRLLRDDGTVTVEAEGVFAVLSPGRVMRLLDPPA